MSDVMVFPDTRQCLTDLIHQTEHLGQVVRVQWIVQANGTGGLDAARLPVVEIYLTSGGTEGYLDRADRLSLACYAPGNDAMNILESVRASILGTGIETPHGYLDQVRVINAPAPSAYVSDLYDRALMTVEVIVRPI